LESLQKSSNKSAAELRRRTAAEDLVELTGGMYPIEFCEVALEQVIVFVCLV
jgi:hypothetical protein